ncbi:MAG TPA: 1-acyl-sn-glycerol-3-phosphate acyltransferase [Chitinophagaceae bacterium]|nr:1-acyl-sn-glycerol-3-phosphate acyltransferase [Chitinophagaceae bacterium]
MNLSKKILGRVFAFWAILVFVITMLPVALLMWVIGLIKEPKRTAVFRNISKVWISIFFLLVGCRLKVKGKGNFKNGANYIVICNHNSFMDVPVATPFIPGANKTIAKIEMSRIPLFGLIYKRGSILVDRNDKDSRRDSFTKMKNVLAMGMHMCIYPEGTRNKTEMPIKEFHNGAFRLAVETGKPIVPAILFNTKQALPANKTFFFWPTKIELHFLQPELVSPTDNYETLKQNMHQLMESYYVTHQL